ncbi:hypothetical protein NEOLEDRAFT_1175292 [Neolentinus lepideus HHB14362 ss-1]|uniref:F-box domain-containing protein n=1 Tax=Neolentinus lepideus HHB14362 ss-1 TaxID=1314782 RepID=A0A165V029_9AGAM|nr:hypothetical protein NEOLEDRAFT_1175292 [Neolentinus lepideus HHB14362 ss-1]
MHRALSISEILTIIFKWALAAGAPKRRLVAFALVCKTWKDPALDERWRVYRDIEGLFRTLPYGPKGQWLNGPDGSFQYRWNTFVAPYELAVMRSYAVRLRDLTLRDSIGLPIMRDIAEKCAFYGSQLLPNLRTLRIDHPDVQADPAQVLPFLMTENLRRIIFMLDEMSLWLSSSRGLQYLADLVSELAPMLEDLRFTLYETPTWDWRAHYDPVPLVGTAFQLPQLRLFQSHLPVQLSDLLLLGELPRLEKVDVTLCNASQNIDDLSVVPAVRQVFPALRVLRISGPSLPHCIRFLDVLREHSLQSLEVEAYDAGPTNAVEIESILQCAGRTSDPASFLSLIISTRDQGRPDYTVNISSLRCHLFKCPNLRKLEIGTVITVDGTDAELEEMAQVWPKIQRLWLGNWPYVDYTHFTIHGLRAFSRHCLELECLSVAVNADIQDGDHDVEMEESSSPLTYLNLGNSSVGDPHPVIKLLDSMFPELYTLNVEDVARLANDPWKIVRDELHLIMTSQDY